MVVYCFSRCPVRVQRAIGALLAATAGQGELFVGDSDEEAKARSTGSWVFATAQIWRVAVAVYLATRLCPHVKGRRLLGLGALLQLADVPWVTMLPYVSIATGMPYMPPAHALTPCVAPAPLQKLFQEAATTLHGY